MMKTIPLVVANIKEFIRNKKSIIILIVFPLVLICLIFLSFNTDGMNIIPVGIISNSYEVNLAEFNDAFSSFMDITYYGNLDSCLSELKQYRQYTCIDIQLHSAVQLDVYFDNTREYVIWEIIGRIKDTVDYIQKEKSKEMASDFLDKFNTNMEKLSDFKVNLINVNQELGTYKTKIGVTQDSLADARQDLVSTLTSMDNDIGGARSAKWNAENNKDNFYNSARTKLDLITNYANSITNVSGYSATNLYYLRNQISYLSSSLESYNTQADNYLDTIDNRLSEYQQASDMGRDYADEIQDGVEDLEDTKDELYNYQLRVNEVNNEINQVEDEFNDIRGLNPDLLVNPVIISNIPVYVPSLKKSNPFESPNSSENAIDDAIKGLNLISLQTLFPTVLFLISLFLSLLVSSFICLRQINSTANTRLKLVKNIFFPSFISTFLSAHIIMFIPLLLVLLLGQSLFQLSIFSNLGFIIMLMFLLTSIYIFFGMAFAYLIKKQSITLLVITFILVFLIFFSGFLLPIERMSPWANAIAKYFPGNLVLNAFNKVVFYSQSFSVVNIEIQNLIVWFIVFAGIALLIKKLKKL